MSHKIVSKLKVQSSSRLLIFLLYTAIFFSSASPSNAFSPFDLLTGKSDESDKKDDLGEILDSDMFSPSNIEGDITYSAQIVILDKRLGKPSAPITLEAGKEFQYGELFLTLQRCWQEQSLSWDKDSRALIKTRTATSDDATSLWLSSKFPGLTNIHNQRFEIMLQKCLAS